MLSGYALRLCPWPLLSLRLCSQAVFMDCAHGLCPKLMAAGGKSLAPCPRRRSTDKVPKTLSSLSDKKDSEQERAAAREH